MISVLKIPNCSTIISWVNQKDVDNKNENEITPVNFQSPVEALLYSLTYNDGEPIIIESEVIGATLLGLENVVKDYLELMQVVEVD